MTVTVVGVGDGAPPAAAARAALAEADLLVGSARNLRLAGAPEGVERVELGALAPALDRLRAARQPVVVASGDPGFFGILRALRQEGHECRSYPAVSSVAALCARAGVPWDDTAVVSAHGRELAAAANAVRALPAVAVLTGPGAGAVELARALAGWPRELVIGARLGAGDEQVTRGSAEQIARRAAEDFTDPHVVLCRVPGAASAMRRDNQPAAAPVAGWALPESEYEHRDSMITKAEVRAYAVARLRPRLGRLVLDIGAGSGAVGIECNRLGAAVVAVERDPAACAAVQRNAARHGALLRVVAGTAPAALAALPAPDAAFVGGGGVPVLTALAAQRVRTVVAAFAALDRAVAAHAALAAAGYDVTGVQLAASRMAALPGGGLRLAATNPVLVLAAELP